RAKCDTAPHADALNDIPRERSDEKSGQAIGGQYQADRLYSGVPGQLDILGEQVDRATHRAACEKRKTGQEDDLYAQRAHQTTEIVADTRGPPARWNHCS